MVDILACKTLDKVEETLPVVTKTTGEVINIKLLIQLNVCNSKCYFFLDRGNHSFLRQRQIAVGPKRCFVRRKHCFRGNGQAAQQPFRMSYT